MESATEKKTARKGKPWRATINMPGVKAFSKSFSTKRNAQAWVKKTETDLETARIEGNGLARNLTLAKLITELTSVRTLNHSVLTALTWWKDNYGSDSLGYGLIDFIEETMEILGMTLFLCALLEYFGQRFGGLAESAAEEGERI